MNVVLFKEMDRLINETGFKVISKVDYKLYSFLERKGYRIRYHRSKFESPLNKNGPLAVFKHYDDAIEFLEYWKDRTDLVIYSCVFERSKRTKQYINKYDEGGWWLITNGTFPDGTVLADRVKLMEQVS